MSEAQELTRDELLRRGLDRTSSKLLGCRVGADRIPGLLGFVSGLVNEYRLAVQEAGSELRVGWLFFGWLKIRSHLEYAIAVTREFTPKEVARAERLQRRALASFVVDGMRPGANPAAAVVAELFGCADCRDRRSLARIKLLLQVRALCRRREALVGYREAIVEDDSDLPAAVPLLLRRSEHLVREGQRRARRRSDSSSAACFWRTSILAVLLREFDAMSQLPAAAQLLADMQGEDGDDGVDPLDDPLTDWPGSRPLRLRITEASRVLRQEAQRRRSAELQGLASAAMLRVFAPTKRWRSQILMMLPMGPAKSAYLAVLAGGFWPCPVLHTPGDRRPTTEVGYQSNKTSHL